MTPIYEKLPKTLAAYQTKFWEVRDAKIKGDKEYERKLGAGEGEIKGLHDRVKRHEHLYNERLPRSAARWRPRDAGGKDEGMAPRILDDVPYVGQH